MYLSLSLQVNSNLTLPLNLACAWMELKGLTLMALVLHATTFCRCLEVIHEMLRADSFKIGMHWQNMMRNTPTTSPQLISCLRSRNQDKSAQCGLLLSRTQVRTVHCYACVARYLSAEYKREEHAHNLRCSLRRVKLKLKRRPVHKHQAEPITSRPRQPIRWSP